MTTRTIDLSTYPMKDQHLIDWLTANGIEPRRVLVSQRVHVAEDSISLKLLVLDENGRKQIVRGQPLEEAVAVPLVSPPEAHGLKAQGLDAVAAAMDRHPAGSAR